MIDQTASDYDTPAVYLPRIIDWAEAAVDRCTVSGGEQAQQGFTSNAEAYNTLAYEYRAIEDRARVRLEALTDLPEDAPPSGLVELTDWLRTRLGRDFPHMPAELWQALATVLRPFRRLP